MNERNEQKFSGGWVSISQVQVRRGGTDLTRYVTLVVFRFCSLGAT